MPEIQLTCIPAFSAIYYALLQNGYEFSQIERDEKTRLALQRFAESNATDSFFSHIWQPSCEVYPYWPRAALLETASLFIEADGEFHHLEGLHKLIHSFTSISDSDRNDNFWQWLMNFPSALSKVQRSEGFQKYLQWEQSWIKSQNLHYADDLATIHNALATICKLPGCSSVPKLEIVISPIKCVYSADYHLIDGRFIFSSGRLSASSVVHESLHPIIHPYVLQYSEQITNKKPQNNSIEKSYYLNGCDEGYLNAFEEMLVRKLTSDLMAGHLKDIDMYISELLS